MALLDLVSLTSVAGACARTVSVKLSPAMIRNVVKSVLRRGDENRKKKSEKYLDWRWSLSVSSERAVSGNDRVLLVCTVALF